MSEVVACPGCGASVSVTSKFCTTCGGQVQARADLICPACGHANEFATRFCAQCGKDLTEVGDPDAIPGFVAGGEWNRAPGEFVRQVTLEQMNEVFGAKKELHVPNGSIGVVLADGAVKEILEPGHRTTVGWWDGLRGWFSSVTGGLTRDTTRSMSFYLVDLRPVVVQYSIPSPAATPGTQLQLQVIVEARLPKSEPAWPQLEAFLRNAVGSGDSYSQQDVYRLLKPLSEREAKAGVRQHSQEGRVDFEAVQQHIVAALTKTVTPDYGFAIHVTAAPLASIVSNDFHLGTGPAPGVRTCTDPNGTGCKAELPEDMKFCASCGGRQPERTWTCKKCGVQVSSEMKFCTGCGEPYKEPTAREREQAQAAEPLFTSDGQEVEVDLVLRCQGEGEVEADWQRRIVGALAAAARQLLRGMTFEQLVSAEGFARLEETLASRAREALETLGLRLIETTVLDVKSKTGEWLLGARADLDRARQEALVGREWLEVESDNVDLQELTNTLALRQHRVELDFKFEHERLRVEDELRRLDVQLDHDLRTDQARLGDRERRQDLADRGAAADVADAQRASATGITVDEADRRLARHTREQDHVDTTVELGRGQELEHARLQHEMATEVMAADHDAGLTRKASELESDLGRRQVDDQAYAARSVQDTAFRDLERRQDLELDRETQQQELELSAEDRRRKGKVEELRAMAEMEAAMTAQDQSHERQVAEEQHAHRQAMTDKMSDMSEAQMLAAQAAELAAQEGGGAFAEALGKMADGRAASAEQAQQVQQEMYERMMAEKAGADESTQGRLDAQQAQMMQMMQNMMASQQQMAETALGAQAAAGQATQDAYKQAAEQASSMSERSMDAMSGVASTASQRPDVQNIVTPVGGGAAARPRQPEPRRKAEPPPQPEPPRQAAPPPQAEPPAQPEPAPKAAVAPRCASCGAALAPPYAFCGECGSKQG